MSLLDKINATAESGKQEGASIPAGSIVKAMMSRITYTKKGEAAASIIQGIGVHFIYLGFYKDATLNEYVPVIDYTDLDNITFPRDIQDPDTGKWDRTGVLSKPVYLSPGVLKSARNKMKSSDDETIQALFYASIILRMFGPGMSEAFVNVLANSGLVTINPTDVGIEKFEEKYPIGFFYRNTYWAYQKSDYVLTPAGDFVIDSKTKKRILKPDVVKSFNEDLHSWVSGTKPGEEGSNPLALVPLEYLSPEDGQKIIQAVQKRQEQKKLEKEAVGADIDTGDAPF